MIRFFNPGLGYSKIKSEIDEAITRVLTKGDLILRDDVETFEKNLAQFVGTDYAIALNSGTDALYLALRYIGVGPGNYVLLPSYTFVATAQVVKQLGATPVFYDRDGSFEESQSLFTAIIVVHMEGEADRNLNRMLRFADKYSIPIIEDACQGLGGSYAEPKWKDSMKLGSIGRAGAFSFYPAKILGAYGDGGALTTNDYEMYEWVKEARNHFKNDSFDWGINSRLDNLQAAVLNVKFKYLPFVLDRRREIAEKYNKAFSKIKEIKLPPETAGRVWQDYIIEAPDRDRLYDYMKGCEVECLKNNYPFPVHKLPQTQEYESSTLRLPCNENLTDEEVDYVIKYVKEYYAR